jgi:hypothetical protein
MDFTENYYAWDPCENFEKNIKKQTKNIYIRNFPNMIVTPIPQNRKANGRKDYREQMLRIQENKIHVWDDSRYNKAQKGDIFAYAENRIKINDILTPGIIHVYVIENVTKPENRLPSWSKNVGQGDRNVLELTSKIIYKGDLKEWIDALNYKENYKVQGTIHVNYDRLEKYIDIIHKNNKKNNKSTNSLKSRSENHVLS